MSLVAVIQQQPNEELDYDIPYLDWFDGSIDTLESIQVDVTPVGELAVLGIISSPSTVKLWISGGVNGGVYKVEFTAFTAGGRAKQDELEVQIEEI